MGGLGFGLPRLPPNSLMGSPGLDMSDKLMAVAAILKGNPEAAMQIRMLAQARQQLAAQQSAAGDLTRMVSGSPIPQRPPSYVYDPSTEADGGATGLAPRITVPTSTIPARDPSADAVGGPVTVRAALPFLTRLAMAGGDTSKWVPMLQAAQPKIQMGPGGQPYDENDPATLSRRFRNPTAVNGSVVDLNNPTNENRYLPEAPVKGANPVYDNLGHIVDWALPGGAARAIGASKAAEVGAEEAAKLPYAGPTALAQAAGKGAGEAPYTLVTKDVNGVPTTMTQAQALALAGGGGAPGGDQPRGIRNNNPGNLRPLPSGAWDGQTGVDGGNYAQFGSPEAGVAAADKNLLAKQSRHGLQTVQQIIADPQWGWDPGNGAYAATVAGSLGVKPNDPVNLADPALRQKMLQSIFSVENGRAPPVSPQASGTATAPTPGFHGVNADDAKRLASYEDDAHTAEDVVQKAHQFQDLNKKQASGPGYRPFRVPIPLLRDVDLNVPGALAKQYQTGVPGMENLSMQIAAGLRAPGQRLTQAEIMTNLNRVPSVNSLPAQNDTLVKDIESRAATKRAYANFMSSWLSQHGSLQGADEAWAAGGSGGAKVRTYNKATGALE